MTASFQQTIARVARELPGTFAVCAERLDAVAAPEAPSSPSRLAWNEDAAMPAASVIKLAVALEILCAIEEGSLDGDATLEVRAEDHVIGSGVLAALRPGLRLPLEDVLFLALAISDNTAANLLIDLATAAAINARLAQLGLTTTRLRGRIFRGDEGGELSPTTARELVLLLRRVHARDGLPPRACDRLLALLARTQTASTVGRGLPDTRFAGASGEPPALALATKTGSLVGIVTEAAIVTAPRATYAIALLGAGSGDARPNHDNIARILLSDLSRSIHAAFTR